MLKMFSLGGTKEKTESMAGGTQGGNAKKKIKEPGSSPNGERKL